MLNISECQLDDLSGIEKFTKLKELNASCNCLCDASKLAKLSQMLVLDLHKNFFKNIDFLLEMTNLEVLDLSNVRTLVDISPLKMNKKMKKLSLY